MDDGKLGGVGQGEAGVVLAEVCVKSAGRVHSSQVSDEARSEEDEEGQRGGKREGNFTRRGETVAGAIAGERYPGERGG